jgi:hypothetical protein
MNSYFQIESMISELELREELQLLEKQFGHAQAIYALISGGCSLKIIDGFKSGKLLSKFSTVPWRLFLLKFIPNHSAVFQINLGTTFEFYDHFSGVGAIAFTNSKAAIEEYIAGKDYSYWISNLTLNGSEEFLFEIDADSRWQEERFFRGVIFDKNTEIDYQAIFRQTKKGSG